MKVQLFKVITPRAAADFPAKNIVTYMDKYREYIIDNNLDNDSNSISVRELIDFVENNILPNEEN